MAGSSVQSLLFLFGVYIYSEGLSSLILSETASGLKLNRNILVSSAYCDYVLTFLKLICVAKFQRWRCTRSTMSQASCMRNPLPNLGSNASSTTYNLDHQDITFIK